MTDKRKAELFDSAMCALFEEAKSMKEYLKWLRAMGMTEDEIQYHLTVDLFIREDVSKRMMEA